MCCNYYWLGKTIICVFYFTNTNHLYYLVPILHQLSLLRYNTEKIFVSMMMLLSKYLKLHTFTCRTTTVLLKLLISV